MRLSETVKPISYVKAHAAEIIKDMSQNPRAITITQNGEAKAILLDIHSYEAMKESLAMLKVLSMGMEDVRKGKVKPAREALNKLRERIKKEAKE